MRKLLTLASSAGLVILFWGGAFGQSAQSAPQQRTITLPTAAAGTWPLNYLQAPVVGAPYSAEQVIEDTQTLADGTHIVHPTITTLVFRDSQGRIRTEKPVMAGPKATPDAPRMIQIRDAVARLIYTLDTQHHVAYRAVMTQAPFVPPPARPPHPAGTHEVSPGTGSNGPGTPEWSDPVVADWLGTKVMEGLTVEGERITRTTPAGAVGNDKPRVTVSYTWYSPELNVVVYNKRSDPWNGERIVRLTNITRGEPDRALFQVPADYTIVEDNGSSKITYTIPG